VTHELVVRLVVAAAAVVIAVVVAKLVDHRLARRELAPGTVTRYRILRQSILWSIVFVGVLSALLVVPQVRGVAAGILASSAVIGLVLGFAAQRTIGNFIAGLLIAFTQPIRLGDEIEFEGSRGVVEEVGLVYTWCGRRTPTGW
jgi:small-conductance mechanosensitive channel